MENLAGDQPDAPDAAAGPLLQRDWLCGILRILIARPLGLHIEQLEQLLWAMHYPDAEMPARFRVQVQAVLSRYTSQSKVFRQRRARPVDDLFYSPEGKGSGTWALHRPNAEAWFKRQSLLTDPKRIKPAPSGCAAFGRATLA